MKTLARLLLVLCLALGVVIYWQRAHNQALIEDAQMAHQAARDAAAKADADIATARADTAAAQADTATANKNLATANKKLADLMEQSKSDTQYRVIKTEYIEGKLVLSGQTEPDTGKPIYKRMNAHWLIYVSGVQTKLDYPPIEVTTAAYSQFAQGAVYSRQDIDDAKQ